MEETESTAGMDAALLVVGMHRSGTSMVAGVACRLLGDDIPPRPNASNPHGQFERVDLRWYLDAMLLTRRSTWTHPPSDAGRWPPSRAVDGLARRAARRLGNGARVWKDPRLALTLPVWLRQLPEARVVLVLRHPSEAARSLDRRDGIGLDAAGNLWETYIRAAVQALDGRSVFVASHREVIDDPVAFGSDLARWLGVEDQVRVSSAVESVKGADIALLPDGIDVRQASLWRAIESWHGHMVIDATELPGPREQVSVPTPSVGQLGKTAARTVRRVLRR